MFNRIWKTILGVLYPDVLALTVIGLLMYLIFKTPKSTNILIDLGVEYVIMKWKEVNEKDLR